MLSRRRYRWPVQRAALAATVAIAVRWSCNSNGFAVATALRRQTAAPPGLVALAAAKRQTPAKAANTTTQAALKASRRAPARTTDAPSAASTEAGPEPEDRGNRSLVPELYPVMAIGNLTEVKDAATKLTYMLKSNLSRAVDLLLVGGEQNRAVMLFILAYVNAGAIRVSAQVLPRKRDNRCRLRVLWDFPVDEDSNPEVIRVSSKTDPTLLAIALRARLKSRDGTNLARTVRLELFRTAASKALLAIEQLYWEMRREVTFVPRFERRTDASKDIAEDLKSKGNSSTPLVVTVSAT